MKKKFYSTVRFVQDTDEDYNRIEAVFSGLRAGYCEGNSQPVIDYLWELSRMWKEFSQIPINNDDEIEKPFYFWEAGTYRFEIWHWFDNLCPNGLAVDLMGETPKNS